MTNVSALASSALLAAVGGYADTKPFWDGTREGRLMLQYCTRACRYQFYPRPASVYSGRRTLQWREASGRGRLVAWTVDRISPAAAGESPRILAFVDLDEGVRLLTWLVDCEPTRLAAGQPLVLRWVPLADGLQWPAFAPPPAAGG